MKGNCRVLRRLWEEVYSKIFKQEANDKIIKAMPESIAPYLFYKPTVAGLSLSLDIGGGSSDVAIFDEQTSNAKIISSFKFAGNAIFGDGYLNGDKSDSDNNGFVITFRQEAEKAVKGDK